MVQTTTHRYAMYVQRESLFLHIASSIMNPTNYDYTEISQRTRDLFAEMVSKRNVVNIIIVIIDNSSISSSISGRSNL
ncbi:hypothetical protein FRACYDRAFT_271856 [Fragilariopsis cylindrus CCMP1102]|uniref:Uncharacterized protein n=1 Tax=Fragilariopsis cylindrus CCMP1102 TaxID=635003 RepID=A0A1E7EQJ6_9STRA|nr:hypothetical protein FRACYDRAFT_271856 [Fragilariopsis cylindrus CCMP1102]|eukprot:OEU08149.1 hypothetical protein FRACYDRAFT_271856 [Fragilariopsis cylindrus CCMP1102]